MVATVPRLHPEIFGQIVHARHCVSPGPNPGGRAGVTGSAIDSLPQQPENLP